jgi:hypothetical protein
LDRRCSKVTTRQFDGHQPQSAYETLRDVDTAASAPTIRASRTRPATAQGHRSLNLDQLVERGVPPNRTGSVRERRGTTNP